MKKKGCPYISGRSEWWVEYTYILLWVTAFTAGVQARTSFADMKVGGSCASGRGEIIIIIIIHDRKKNRKRYFLLCHFSSVCSSLAVFSHSHTHTIKKREEKKTHVCHVFLPPFFFRQALCHPTRLAYRQKHAKNKNKNTHAHQVLYSLHAKKNI